MKEAAAEMILDRAEKTIPGLRASIKYKEIATPITNWRYSRNVGGAIYGTEQTVENMYSGRLQSKTPIENLFLTGAWTFGGGMSAALMSGRETSRMVIGQLDGTEVILMTAPNIEVPPTDEITSQTSPIKSTVTNTQATAFIPDLTLKAIGSGRAVTLNAIGIRTALLFHTADTAEDAARINQSIRSAKEYQNCDSVLVANVVDLHSVPKLFRSIADKSMRESYEKAGKSLPPGEKPQDYVVILPDWDGNVTKSLGLKDTGKTVGLAVLDAQGNVVGMYQGSEPELNALALLQKIA